MRHKIISALEKWAQLETNGSNPDQQVRRFINWPKISNECVCISKKDAFPSDLVRKTEFRCFRLIVHLRDQLINNDNGDLGRSGFMQSVASSSDNGATHKTYQTLLWTVTGLKCMEARFCHMKVKRWHLVLGMHRYRYCYRVSAPIPSNVLVSVKCNHEMILKIWKIFNHFTENVDF